MDLKSGLLVLLALVAAQPLQAGGKKQGPPNIIFLMADDLGTGDLGCYNKKSKIPTPNFDRLAASGVRFTDSHTPSAVCTPTRYGVLTGRYCWRSRLKRGVLNGYSPLLIETDRMTLASFLRSQGYHTGVVGKWHLGLGNAAKVDYSRPLTPGPNTVGFDYFFGIPASLDMAPYVYVENDRVVEAPTDTVKGSKMRRHGGGGFWRAGPIAPSFDFNEVLPKITEKAVSYIEKRAKHKQPFFLYMPLSAPHTPWMPLKKFQGKSKAGPYGDFVVQVDWTVGQILDALDRLKVADNTLIIVTSDNGAHWLPQDIRMFGHLANFIFRGQKADIWEGGHRVPFLVRWPGHTKKGTTCDETICHTDMLATFAGILGKKLPKNAGEDSFNILPAILGKNKSPIREATIHHSANGTFAIRQGDWVFIEKLGSGGFSKPRTLKPKPGGPKGQLYNLAKDIGQKNNLYLQEPQVVTRLQSLLNRYRKQGYSRRR